MNKADVEPFDQSKGERLSTGNKEDWLVARRFESWVIGGERFKDLVKGNEGFPGAGGCNNMVIACELVTLFDSTMQVCDVRNQAESLKWRCVCFYFVYMSLLCLR